MRQFIMIKEYHTSFSLLRRSYIEVKEFLEQESGEEIVSLDGDIEDQLGIAGDDTYELIEKFVTSFGLKADEVILSDHFLSESEQFGAGQALLVFLSVPFIIISYLLKFASFEKVDMTKISLLSSSSRRLKGMTFADLIIWSHTGNIGTRKEVRLVLSKCE